MRDSLRGALLTGRAGRLLLALLLVSALPGTWPASAGQADEVGTKTQALRGGEVIPGFTGVVELLNCTGSMIGHDTVLTAAHCLPGVGVGGVSSGSGTVTISYHDPVVGRRTVFSGTASWFGHRDYDASVGGGAAARVNADIGVVRIPGRFRETDYRDYLRLFSGRDDRLERRLTAYGAGIYTYSGKRDNNLRTHEFAVEHVKKNHIVVDTRKYVGLCKGDSGGPLVYAIDGPSGPVPTVTAVAGRIEFLGFEPEVCTNNDFGIDDAFYSRTNWEKLESVMQAAGVDCELLTVEGVDYRRCFDLPFIEEVEWEGASQGEAVAIMMAALR